MMTRDPICCLPSDSAQKAARIMRDHDTGIVPVVENESQGKLVGGLPGIVPYGMSDYFLKHMSRTIQAWVTVDNVSRRAPLYRLKVEPHDRPEVVPIRAGNFFVATTVEQRRAVRLAPIIDPMHIFGMCNDLSRPEAFSSKSFRLPPHQYGSEKSPSAFGYLRTRLAPDQPRVISSLYGYMASVEELNATLPRIMGPEFFATKSHQNHQLIDELTTPVATVSGLPTFDRYCRQTFLDNLMRGGVPMTLTGDTTPSSSRKTIYVFCRKHGDLERDYNQFSLPATFFSQGNGNYRDVNQNQRCDAWFYPHVGESNLVMFFNLIQLDGFNPLVLKGLRFMASPEHRHLPQVRDIVSKPFTPGELLSYLHRHPLKSKENPTELVSRILANAQVIEDAEHGEGFWTDHWTYNLDLLESYLALYPERRQSLLFEQRIFTFYDNTHVVMPRIKKYRIVKGQMRQYHAVRRDSEKVELLQSRSIAPHHMRTKYGRGPIYMTTLFVKMLCIVVNKVASLDPSGLGVEMEADKPNWYDALNGLPGLCGSSLCETFELKRWALFLQQTINTLGLAPSTPVALPEELAEFLLQVQRALGGSPSRYWEQSARAKERYRHRIRLGISGKDTVLRIDHILKFLSRINTKVSRGIGRSRDTTSGLYPSYFRHEAVAYRESSANAHPQVTPTRWMRHTLPLFLEGVVHALRAQPNPRGARALYRATRRSPLYDQRLKMYRVCDSLLNETEEIGRCRVFSPGWLEHQSVWLHMEYKFLLELLRCGLYEEFYEEFFHVLIPFQAPDRYGRSILENSSFVVSSAYADPALHGAGFVARLSGASAEFLQMWLWMMLGRQPFRVDGKRGVLLQPAPILHQRLFTAQGRLQATLFGKTQLTYVSHRRGSTFGPRALTPSKIRAITTAGEAYESVTGVLGTPLSEQLRVGGLASLDIELS